MKSTHPHDLLGQPVRFLLPLMEIGSGFVQLRGIQLLLEIRLGTEQPLIGLKLIPCDVVGCAKRLKVCVSAPTVRLRLR